MKRGNQPGERFTAFYFGFNLILPPSCPINIYTSSTCPNITRLSFPSLSLAVLFESVRSIIFGPRVHTVEMGWTVRALPSFASRKLARTRYLTPSTIDERTLVAQSDIEKNGHSCSATHHLKAHDLTKSWRVLTRSTSSRTTGKLKLATLRLKLVWSKATGLQFAY